jgi:hypothetical protein
MLITKKIIVEGMSFHEYNSKPFVIAIGMLVSFVISGISSSAFHEALGVSDFNILAVGNWGCNQNSQRTVDNIRDKNTELLSKYSEVLAGQDKAN